MNDDKKKENKIKVSEIVQVATEQKNPPAYNTSEIDGIIVKTYPFIRGHSKIYNQPFPEEDIQQKDYSLLAAYKNELENQLELHRKNCVGHYNMIKLATSLWLKDKFQVINTNDKEREDLFMFAATVDTFIYWTMLGVEVEIIKEDLKGELHKPLVKIRNKVFDIDELIDEVQEKLNKIERIVSRSVGLYFEYVNIHSQLYQFDIDKFLSNKNTDYGIHQSKSDWVEQKWYEVRKNKPSDRQADLELQKLYKSEFGLKISTTQIQRFTDRAS